MFECRIIRDIHVNIEFDNRRIANDGMKPAFYFEIPFRFQNAENNAVAS